MLWNFCLLQPVLSCILPWHCCARIFASLHQKYIPVIVYNTWSSARWFCLLFFFFFFNYDPQKEYNSCTCVSGCAVCLTRWHFWKFWQDPEIATALNCKCQICSLKIRRLSGIAGLLISGDWLSNKSWERQDSSLCPRMGRYFLPLFLSHIQQFSSVGEPVQNLGSQVNMLLFVPQELTPVLLPACLGHPSALSYRCLRLLVPPVLFLLCFVLQNVSKLSNPLFIWVQ